jgi:hypothetical protein
MIYTMQNISSTDLDLKFFTKTMHDLAKILPRISVEQDLTGLARVLVRSCMIWQGYPR